MTGSLPTLLIESLEDPWGKASASYYDTAHLVRAWARAPQRLSADLGEQALSFLLRRQNQDGTWGWVTTPRSYRLIPTLAACVALSAALASEVAVGRRESVNQALARGLASLNDRRGVFVPEEMPDTVAIEYLLPALLEELHGQLSGERRRRFEPIAAPFSGWWKLLAQLREDVISGKPIPEQRQHCWEIFDSIGAPPPPVRNGCVACSPAATAAVLSRLDIPAPEAVEYLRRSAGQLDGAQPVVLPLVIFERAWLVANAYHAGADIPGRVRARLVTGLRSFWRSGGVGAAPGLAIEADDTANYLLAMLRLGVNTDLDCLLEYEGASAFRTYRSVERNTSVSTNAHVLEALRQGMALRPELTEKYAVSAKKAQAFLLSVQHSDGYWTDKWHASPYYATSCAAYALESVPAQTIRWLLDNQREDGSWGIWCGTLEETAYAVQTLIRARGVGDDAATRGLRFLDEASDATPDDPVRTPLWHSKELYSPLRVVSGLVLSTRLGARSINAVG